MDTNDPISKNYLFNQSHYRMALHVEGDSNNLNMLKLARIDELRNKAEEYEFFLPFDEGRGVDAIFKEYSTPNNTPFAALNELDRLTFLRECYDEVNALKEIIENTFHKFDGENNIINELCRSLPELTSYQWHKWPDHDCAWDLVTDFNKETHQIGIEGSFAVNTDSKIEFRSYITVWQAYNWDIYEKLLKERYPNQHIDKKGKRVYLHLPVISIGDDLTSWSEKKERVGFRTVVEHFSFTLSSKNIEELFDSIGESLVAAGCAQKEKSGMLGNKNAYIPDKKAVDTIIQNIRAEILEDGELTEDIAALTAILDKTGELMRFFSAYEKKDVKKRLKEIKNNPENKEISKVINYVEELMIIIIV